MATAFFYGILIHPKILKRVLDNDASHLRICPAILKNYTRFQVKFADYPAIVPSERSEALLGRELTPDESSVRGTLVTGLTSTDIAFLDVFEGNEYIRSQVLVHPLGPFTPVPATSDSEEEGEETEDSLPVPAGISPLRRSAGEAAQTVPAQSYVWCVEEDSRLDSKLWSYEEFLRKNAWKWIDEDPESEAEKDYAEVDKIRERRREQMVRSR
ncbi:hypothetical protein BJV78DRAFT_860080 [Lactifluus subvellereus]|nr:hypothetical protein BJV78DRAFT_860080 [Lactifluus subvellereus]